jgi:hypothetical protein
MTLTIDDIETTMTNLTSILCDGIIKTNINALVACKTNTLQTMASYR